MQKILAPTDFSDPSVNAVTWAADLACVSGAELYVLHVSPLPASYSEVPPPVSMIQDMHERAVKRMKELKEKLLQHTHDSIRIHTQISQGDVLLEIESLAGKIDPYAIVMGPEHEGALQRLLTGSHTLAAAKQSRYPVIVVPADCRYSKLKRIGLGIELNEVIKTIPVDFIKRLQQQFHAALYVFHISIVPGAPLAGERKEEAGWLSEILKEMDPQYHYLYQENVEEGLCRYAEKYQLDMLIVFPHRRNFFKQLFFPGHTRALALHSNIPVLFFHD
ncbi:MAG: universal stress protein [Chitinophagaceae bacterium]|nr:universal stress protein [Chitinophagaceae bacterium]